jgi:hypothetical protein
MLWQKCVEGLGGNAERNQAAVRLCLDTIIFGRCLDTIIFGREALWPGSLKLIPIETARACPTIFAASFCGGRWRETNSGAPARGGARA